MSLLFPESRLSVNIFLLHFSFVCMCFYLTWNRSKYSSFVSVRSQWISCDFLTFAADNSKHQDQQSTNYVLCKNHFSFHLFLSRTVRFYGVRVSCRPMQEVEIHLDKKPWQVQLHFFIRTNSMKYLQGDNINIIDRHRN